jgi:hypothetical protein
MKREGKKIGQRRNGGDRQEPDHDLRLKTDGAYIVEFKTTKGEALAISVARGETAMLKYFQERMPYGLFMPDEKLDDFDHEQARKGSG